MVEHKDQEEDVLAANASFYRAFREGDVALMDAVWAVQHEVVCIHPGWQALCGRDAILRSFARIVEGPKPPSIECHDPKVFFQNDVAVVICSERIQNKTLVATNIFTRETAGWVMVHHHAGPGQGLGLSRGKQTLH